MVEADPSGAGPTSTQPEGPSDLEKKIIRQIEYYFGDINLGKDKFLQEQIKLDDGWIPMETMLKFNRLANLSKDTDVIARALLKSSTKLMEVSEDNKKIRRSPDKPLPEMNEARRKELMSRTAYVKGFPLEGTTMSQLLDFFPQFGEIENVIMRSYIDKATKTWKFKGSVFVIFSTVDGVKKFLEGEAVKYNDKELIKKWQTDYFEEKRKERLEAKAKKQKPKNDNEQNDNDGNEEAEEDNEFPRGSVVQLKGLGNSDVSREDLKAAVQKLGVGVAFVDFSKGQDEAWLRLDSEGAAIEMVSLIKEGVIEIKENVKAEVRIIEGEEEETFLAKAKEDKKRIIKRSRNKSRRGKGNFGRGRKRKGSPSRESSQKKAQKTD